MKNLFSWQIKVALVLIALSLAGFYIHYRIFNDLRNLEYYVVFNIAFLFIEVLLVTMVIHGLLNYREKRALLNKLNMEIGAFYSEVGVALLRLFSLVDSSSHIINGSLCVTGSWEDKDFKNVDKVIKRYEPNITYRPGEMDELKRFLSDKRDFLLRLIENPNLLEHESFTNLLWAVFHLTEELSYRKDLSVSSVKDIEHIAADMKRVYSLLIREWLEYMKHLKNNYPYLFSFAMRTNPFDREASVVIR